MEDLRMLFSFGDSKEYFTVIMLQKKKKLYLVHYKLLVLGRASGCRNHAQNETLELDMVFPLPWIMLNLLTPSSIKKKRNKWQWRVGSVYKSVIKRVKYKSRVSCYVPGHRLCIEVHIRYPLDFNHWKNTRNYFS